ncbi:unnamed protein product (macronuclear) [Paramecium tetraurelia]|uniref:Uncharacterized protein n=1 Tax=Paramecium tetraurelia TaxID=5888 RepID=A0DCD8_PARTE|nr:uncharacterized protein GSPATT00015583001 [Paramecium tetraurelia]CAK80705.1 unnamed protein product [Paramecium tetraurelia]|eukprot:XP_001448102.1 hypothetical protein (macronuclear) [Paramecium tetraurelia strain d4-2]
MRLRQTYQPNYLQISQSEKPKRNVYSYGKELNTPDSIKPLSPLMNLRLFLYKTKQKLEFKQVSQFTRNDPLVKEQPSFLFNKLQIEQDNQIKFQAYLDGDLQAEEYLTLQNYKRLYNITKNDNGSFDNTKDEMPYYTQRESALKKLKERIIHRYHLNKRKRGSEISSQVDTSKGNTPGIQLAKQLKKVIIRKNMNKINEEMTAENTLKNLKMVQNADFAVQRLQETLEQDKPFESSVKKKVNSTKHLKIITRRNKTETNEDYQNSRIQLNNEIVHLANQTIYESQTQDKLKQLKSKTLKFSDAKMNQVLIQKSLQSFQDQRRCITDRSQQSQGQKNNSKQKLHYQGEQKLEERDDSAESSLCSLFEKKINSLYNQSILLKKNISNKDNLIKRIKHMQSFNQIVGEAVQTNNQKLYKI